MSPHVVAGSLARFSGFRGRRIGQAGTRKCNCRGTGVGGGTRAGGGKGERHGRGRARAEGVPPSALAALAQPNLPYL